MEAKPLTITLHDSSRGYEVVPERIPLATLRDFTSDVEALLKGDLRTSEVVGIEVSVIKGSFALQTTSVLSPELFQDLLKLISSQIIDGINTKRREVIARWQNRARDNVQVQFEISSGNLPQSIWINQSTDYRADDADQWVHVERYFRGEIIDLGK